LVVRRYERAQYAQFYRLFVVRAAHGFNDAAYAASEIMSSIESFSITGFMGAPRSHELFPSLNASRRNIGDPTRASIAPLELLNVHRNLNDALAKWLRPRSQGHGQMPINNPCLRCGQFPERLPHDGDMSNIARHAT
jgi:hypothetical protein